jgi:hypothetical protein
MSKSPIGLPDLSSNLKISRSLAKTPTRRKTSAFRPAPSKDDGPTKTLVPKSTSPGSKPKLEKGPKDKKTLPSGEKRNDPKKELHPTVNVREESTNKVGATSSDEFSECFMCGEIVSVRLRRRVRHLIYLAIRRCPKLS